MNKTAFRLASLCINSYFILSFDFEHRFDIIMVSVESVCLWAEVGDSSEAKYWWEGWVAVLEGPVYSLVVR